MKVWEIARRLLYQSRWLFLLMALWPAALAVLLLLAGGPPNAEDVLSILHQECLYGLALVTFTGSIQLGNEQRSRRIASVLSRAVSRPQYLFALFWAAWIPLALYAAGFLVAGTLLAVAVQQPAVMVAKMTLALLLLGMWAAAVSLFFAVWLPSLLASAATLAVLGVAAGLGYVWPRFGLSRSLAALLGIPSGEGPLVDALLPWGRWDWGILAMAAVAFFVAAAAIFERRDLRLKGE